VDAEVFEIMKPLCIPRFFGQPPLVFILLEEKRGQALEESRRNIANLINASPEEIIFYIWRN